MGCIQSQQRPRRKKKVSNPSTPTQEELEAARLLAAAKSQTPPKAEPRRETDVLRRADAMDKAHEEALKSPVLQKLEVQVGDQTQRLLQGFAMKEADAHSKPELRTVGPTDLRESKLYNVLRGFEEKEERARSEPKLEKTFSEREREREQGNFATSPVAHSLASPVGSSLSSANARVSSLTTL